MLDKYLVLDDGFVRLVDVMGDDKSIVQAARVSYGDGTTHVSDDRALVRYLLSHGHTSPFEMCEIKLHVRVPMDCWRQWIRHRTANVNEYSTRYSVAIDSMKRTQHDRWRKQSKGNRQGSLGYISEKDGVLLTEKEKELHMIARNVYNERINMGVAREQARKDLPLSTYTEAYWKIDLHNLLHFLELRMEEHAQIEIREYAKVIAEKIVAKWVPITWEAFLDYKYNSLKLSSMEIEMISMINKKAYYELLDMMVKKGFLKKEKDGYVEKREGIEFKKKLIRMSIVPPWKYR
jgi:thymidylate synthase (FAD)